MESLQTLTKAIDPSEGTMRIILHDPHPDELLLPNGVYVPQGERPDHATMEKLAEMFRTAETASMETHERIIPSGQTTDGVVLGPFMHFGFSAKTPKNINSEVLNNCLALVAVGKAKAPDEKGKQLGLYCHVNPWVMRSPLVPISVTEKQIAKAIQAFKEATVTWTRDALISGGDISLLNKQRCTLSAELHIHCVEMLAKHAAELEVTPTCTAPSLGVKNKYTSLETQARTAHIRHRTTPDIKLPEAILPRLYLATSVRKHIEKVLSIIEWKQS